MKRTAKRKVKRMALLTEAKRKAYFKELGLGAYNKANILKFQKKYFTRKKDQDGLYGPDTDNLLRHCYNVHKYTKNFRPEEFRCGCGRKYCTGYPTYMKPAELVNLQTIRSHYGKSMTITSGMRCRGFNSSLRGSSTNSKHLTGQAADFYMAGVTDTLARRKSAIAYIKKLPNHNWTYGNGWSSMGYAVNAPNMGNALHTDALNNPVKVAAKAPAKKTRKKKADPLKPWYDAMTTQYAWSKGQRYKWTIPTIESSREKGTCITFPAVSLQRLKLLPKGGYIFWSKQDGGLWGSVDYIKKHPRVFEVLYPNKVPSSAKLKKGDICCFERHTMVYMGKDTKGRLRWNTMGEVKRGLNVTYPSADNQRVKAVIRLKRVKP